MHRAARSLAADVEYSVSVQLAMGLMKLLREAEGIFKICKRSSGFLSVQHIEVNSNDLWPSALLRGLALGGLDLVVFAQRVKINNLLGIKLKVI